MEIKIYGPGCAKCVAVEKLVREAAAQKSPYISVEKIEASGIHVGEKQPAIPANLKLDNSFDGLEMLH